MAYVSLQDEAGTDIMCNIIDDEMGNGGVEITTGGDCELSTLADALEFAARTLRAGMSR